VNAFVSRVFTTRGRYLNLNKIELDGNTEGLVLMMAASDFILEENMRYRFKFDARDWTPWCGNPELVFHVLPPGKHIIQVEAQDVFGRISTLKPVTVEVGYTRADFVKYGLSSVLACIGTICIAVVWIRARKKRVSRVAT
jgi:hypothetical protein